MATVKSRGKKKAIIKPSPQPPVSPSEQREMTVVRGFSIIKRMNKTICQGGQKWLMWCMKNKKLLHGGIFQSAL